MIKILDGVENFFLSCPPNNSHVSKRKVLGSHKAVADFDEQEFIEMVICAILIYLCRINNYQSTEVLFSYRYSNENTIHKNRKKSYFNPNSTIYTAEKKIKKSISFLFGAESEKICKISRLEKIQIEWDSHIFNGCSKNSNKLYFLLSCKNKVLKTITPKDTNMRWQNYISEHVSSIFSDLLDRSEKKISSIQFLTQGEIDISDLSNKNVRKVDFNLNILEFVEENAKKFPNRTSFVGAGKEITYKDLIEKVNKFSNYLSDNGLKQGDFSAIFLDRSLEMLVSVLAILKIGGAYVPIDTSCPPERIKYIFRNSKSTILITSSSLENRYLKNIDFPSSKKINVDLVEEEIQKISPLFNGKIFKKRKKIAYLLYTSGTTGFPKGVFITHANIINYATWFSEIFHLNKNSIIDFSSSLAFDVSVACTLVPLMNGSKIALCSEREKLDPILYLQHLIKNEVTHIEAVPDYFNHMLHHQSLIKRLVHLKWILLGGDAVIKRDLEKWFSISKKQKICNEYGPTECTVAVTAYIVQEKNINKYLDIVPIGKPAFNTQAYILDKYKNFCPIGVPGELYISGKSMFIGYTNHKETKNKISRLAVSGGERKIYKTGDLARWASDGNILFLGRIDSQVKIRGFRIELLEIENCLLKNASVKQCKILVKKKNDGEKYLSAYVISEKTVDSLDQNELRTFLMKSLPFYMLPAEFIFLREFPVYASGKINIKDLLNSRDVFLKKRTKKIIPSTVVEDKLFFIWKEIFNMSPSDSDDFFSMGGNSLSALKIINNIEDKFGVRLSTTAIFENPTFSELAKVIEASQSGSKNVNNLAKHGKRPSAICMRPSHGNHSLFLLHPVGGTVFFYRALINFLENKMPIYAIQDPAVDDPKITFGSLREMASVYLQSLRKIQPHGPYFLAGASFGATLVVELANQLSCLGEEIAFVGLFDGWAQYPEILKDKEFFKRTIRQKFKEQDLPANMEVILDRQYLREMLLFQYEIPKFSGRVTLFKAEIVWPIFQSMDSHFNGWDKYFENPPSVYNVPGDHESMFDMPHVEILACLVSTRIADAKVGNCIPSKNL